MPLQTHPSDAGGNRNPPTQDYTEMSLLSQQGSQTDQGITERVETPHGGHFAARLPKLEIPIFTGEPLEWQPFWDCFEAAIDANPSLTGVQNLASCVLS